MAPLLFLGRGLGRCGGPGGGRLLGRAGSGLGRLRNRRARRAHGGLHRHAAATRAGQRAADEQQPALGIDAHDLDVLDRAPHRAQVTRHALAGKHAARVLVLADRAGLVVRDRIAVARAVGGEVMALDDAGEALALRRPGDVHLLADLEDVRAHGPADLQVGGLVRLDAELPHGVPGLDAGLGEMPGRGLVHAARPALPVRDLHRGIAVGVGRLYLGDAVIRHVDHGHRDGVALVGEHAGHADLAPYQAQTHVIRLFPKVPAAIGRLFKPRPVYAGHAVTT